MAKEKIKAEQKRAGTKKQTSTSKTIKRMAKRKNFMQNGMCEEPMGSKPHS